MPKLILIREKKEYGINHVSQFFVYVCIDIA
jgi:hypothetical protein